jgi:hypothetical protein
MFYSNLSSEIYATVPIENDYRQFGIISNPRNLVGGSNLTDPVSANQYAISGTFSPAQFPVGTSITNGTDVFTISAIIIGATVNGAIVDTGGIDIVGGQILAKVGFPAITITVATSVRRDRIDSVSASTCFVVGGVFTQADFISDTTIVVSGNKRFRVISSTASKMMLLPINNGTIISGAVLNIEDSLISFTTTTVVPPTVDKNTGDILFIDNRTAFNQTVDQTVTFRTVIAV